uniref:BTB domain-containing protein n=1 Tax=Panagrellus redivivus TaxID=6233 RepID=A0A7E4ZTV9_PANRE
MSTEFQDTVEIKISRKEVEELAGEDYVSIPERAITGSNGIRWAFRVYGKNSTRLLPVHLWVSEGPLKADGTFTAGPAKSHTFGFHTNTDGNSASYLLGEFCPTRLGPDGFVHMNITFTNFEKAVLLEPSTINDFIIDSGDYLSDARIVVDDKTIEVHRSFLCIISPVFRAAFTHDTKEAKTGTINIKDFSFETVKHVIDYCYGRPCGATKLQHFVDILMFADKYDMKTLIKKFEPLFLRSELSPENFTPIAKYAWDLDKADLKTLCAKFYFDNHGKITLTPEFLSLHPSTQLDIIHSAASLS